MSAHHEGMAGGTRCLRGPVVRIYRAMTPRDREITFDSKCRLRDGQPLEQNLIELGIDFGQSTDEARESARKAMSGDKYDPRKGLD